MAENIENKVSQLYLGGNPSRNQTFRLNKKESNMMLLLRRIKTFWRHEFSSEYHVVVTLKRVQDDIRFFYLK